MAKMHRFSVAVQICMVWTIFLASDALGQSLSKLVPSPQRPDPIAEEQMIFQEILKAFPEHATTEFRSKIQEFNRLTQEMLRLLRTLGGPGGLSGPAGLPEVAAFPREHRLIFDNRQAVYHSLLSEIANWEVTTRAVAGGDGVKLLKTGRYENLYAGVMFQPMLVIAGSAADDQVENMRRVEARNGFIRLQAPLAGETTLYFCVVGSLSDGRNTVPIILTDANDAELGRAELKLNAKRAAKLHVKAIDPNTGRPTPVRVGVYTDGHFQLAPSAIPLYVFYEIPVYRDVRDPTWPNENKTVFYTDGEFAMSVPPGKCRMILQKGIEFLRVDDSFEARAGETIERQYEMKRWVDLPKQGWYSADDHVHVPRDSRNNEQLSKWLQAEDVHVANIVQMGDILRLHFLQYSWSDVGMYQESTYVMRTGQEDPRTEFRGHTIVINNTMTIHDRETYYIYEDVADTARRQGGMYGYAHMGEAFNAERGLSISVPLRKADFLEVLQFYRLGVETLYHFWNLGFKLIPTAGSDFPFALGDTAGNAKFFVHLDKPFSWANWYAALQDGKTFVSDGPILNFTVNAEIAGSELKLNAPGVVKIHAVASLNPTIDKLSFLEIVQNGKVIRREELKDGSKDSFAIDMDIDVHESCWVAAHAEGKNSRSHSAAIYITVAGKPFYNRAELSDRLRRANGKLDEVIQESAQAENDPILKANAPRLRDLAEAARAIYSGMAKEAGVQW